VTCYQDGYVQKFDSNGELKAKWGGRGGNLAQFLNPQGIAVDSSGNVYVADTGNRRIQKFRSNGSFVRQWRTYARGPVRGFRPVGIAVDPAGYYVYVTDDEHNRILKFTIDGFPVREWGHYGTEMDRFVAARDIAVSRSGDVYVADSAASSLKVFSKLGSPRKGWGDGGIQSQSLARLIGVAVDYSGNCYVTDASHCIQQYNQLARRTGWFGGCDDPEHEAEGQWHDLAGPHQPRAGDGPGQFRSPRGIAADLAGNLYVADFENHRIQKLVTLQTSTERPAPSSR
jgi:DNA-binding beta-propeller fold protein YncE